MENKITISSLAASLAKNTGKTKKLCEDFLREYFRIIAESLEAGEAVKIKGLGTFKISEVESRASVNVNTGEPHEIASYKKVVFTPAKELAAEINAPFLDFDTVEMDDEVPEEVFYEDSIEDARDDEEPDRREDGNGDENNVSEARLEMGSMEEGDDDIITAEAYNIENSNVDDKPVESQPIPVSDSPQIMADSLPAPEPEAVFPPTPVSTHEIEQQIMEEQNAKLLKSRFGIGFVLGAVSTFAVCVLIFALGCFFGWWPVNFKQPKKIVAIEQQVVPVDTHSVGDSDSGSADLETTEETPVVSEPKIKPVAKSEPDKNEKKQASRSDKVIYDTVTKTRYLTTIAREHYGNYNLWPYIYMENEKILGHPDRITPGTKVVVPDLAKYGVDPKNKEDIKKAKNLGVKIYAKYK